MALGFDGQLLHGRRPARLEPPYRDGSQPPARGLLRLLGGSSMHDNGTTVETFAKIAAKNWNHARFNKYAERQAQAEATVEQVLASPMVAYPHTAMMACGAGAGAAGAIVATREVALKLANGRPLVRVMASQMQSEVYQPGHIFLGARRGALGIDPHHRTSPTPKQASGPRTSTSYMCTTHSRSRNACMDELLGNLCRWRR